MAPHSGTPAWKIPWMEEPSRLQSMGSLRVGHDWVTSLSLFTFHFHALDKETATHSSVLAWRIPGMEELGGLPSMGLHRVRHHWSDLAASINSSQPRQPPPDGAPRGDSGWENAGSYPLHSWHAYQREDFNEPRICILCRKNFVEKCSSSSLEMSGLL